MLQSDVSGNKTVLRAHTFLLGERIESRVRGVGQRLGATTPTVVRAGQDGFAVIFRYGAVVLFGLDDEDEASFLERLKPFVRNPLISPVVDDLELVVDPNLVEGTESDGRIVLRAPSIERLQLVADVLAESVVLDHYEAKVSETFDGIEPMAKDLERRGKTRHRSKKLLKHIGSTLLTQHRMVGRVEIGENPEILWDNPELERLYIRLIDEYELRERHLAIERKLELISRTAETALELLHNKRSLRVEWYIVILILIEIVLILYFELLR
jgi:uncharacterized Rmd1/YagE family protein